MICNIYLKTKDYFSYTREKHHSCIPIEKVLHMLWKFTEFFLSLVFSRSCGILLIIIMWWFITSTSCKEYFFSSLHELGKSLPVLTKKVFFALYSWPSCSLSRFILTSSPILSKLFFLSSYIYNYFFICIMNLKLLMYLSVLLNWKLILTVSYCVQICHGQCAVNWTGRKFSHSFFHFDLED